MAELIQNVAPCKTHVRQAGDPAQNPRSRFEALEQSRVLRVRLRLAMVKTVEDLEAQLLRLDRKFERLEDGTLLVRLAANQPPAALRLAEPVLVIQVEIGPVPADAARHAALFRKLLEFNAKDLLHAAYGLSGNSIVLLAGLVLSHLDPNELEATLADFDLALAEHVGALHTMSGG
jgi:Putative bacterial sensory transduction regulator